MLPVGFCAKLKVCASKYASSPSVLTLFSCYFLSFHLSDSPHVAIFVGRELLADLHTRAVNDLAVVLLLIINEAERQRTGTQCQPQPRVEYLLLIPRSRCLLIGRLNHIINCIHLCLIFCLFFHLVFCPSPQHPPLVNCYFDYLILSQK